MACITDMYVQGVQGVGLSEIHPPPPPRFHVKAERPGRRRCCDLLERDLTPQMPCEQAPTFEYFLLRLRAWDRLGLLLLYQYHPRPPIPNVFPAGDTWFDLGCDAQDGGSGRLQCPWQGFTC